MQDLSDFTAFLEFTKENELVFYNITPTATHAGGVSQQARPGVMVKGPASGRGVGRLMRFVGNGVGRVYISSGGDDCEILEIRNGSWLYLPPMTALYTNFAVDTGALQCEFTGITLNHR